MSGESQVEDQERILLDPRPVSSSVWLRADASQANLAMIAAVAVGAAEALDLELEPATRLRTIAVEAAGNAIAHAYPDSLGGPLELQIGVEDPLDERLGRRIHVRVRDEGIGLPLPPRPGDPPGLGLPIISSLAERFSLASSADGGTAIDATIAPDADFDAPGGRGPPAMPDSCLLSFGDNAFLQPILGRALAAQVSAGRIDVDRLGETIRVGDAIATHLEAADLPPTIRPHVEISRWREADQLRISVGPLDRAATEGIATSLADTVPQLETSVEAAGNDAATTLITLPA